MVPKEDTNALQNSVSDLALGFTDKCRNGRSTRFDGLIALIQEQTEIAKVEARA